MDLPFAVNTTSGLRGDYAAARPDYTVDQDHAAYSPADHAMWRRLYARQAALAERYACRPYLEGLSTLDAADAVPDLALASERLTRLTGWRLVAVPGFIPHDAFYAHLAGRRFPVTTWIRRPEEMDYLVEPDIFHDFFGHVPLLSNPVFARFMEEYGRLGVEAAQALGIDALSRLYWFTVEFGLVRAEGGLKVFGAGLLSSAAEVVRAVDSAEPERLPFALDRVVATPFSIDGFQPRYFVIDDFAQMFDAVRSLADRASPRLAA